MSFWKWLCSLGQPVEVEEEETEPSAIRVLVSTMDDCSLVGVLLCCKPTGWLLGETHLEGEDRKYTKLPGPGVVFVPAHRVTLVQELDDSFEMDVAEPAALQEVEGQHGKP